MGNLEEEEINKHVNECLSVRVKEKKEQERPPVDTQDCPICGKSVAENEMNKHVDDCLSVKAIEEISQAEEQPGFQDDPNPVYHLDTDVDDTGPMLRNDEKEEEVASPVLVGKQKRRRMASSSSEDASISLLAMARSQIH